MDLSALTIQQLRYLVAVDRHRSFRNAALASHVSQPALSTQIKRLEDILGLTVFDRSRQPVAVTEEGAAIVTQARLALEHFDRIGALAEPASHARRAGEKEREITGSVRVGIIPTLVPTLVPLLAPALSRLHPRLTVELVETRTAALTRSLREGTLDAGFAATPLEVGGLDERIVYHEAFYAYLPDGHPLLAEPRVQQSDLVDEHVWLLSEGHCFRAQVLHLCSIDRRRPAKGTPSVRFDGGSFETLAALVDAGEGITILPELTVRALPTSRQTAHVRPFVAPEPMREISLVSARDAAHGPVLDALFKAARGALPPDVVGRRPRRSTIVRPE